MIKRMKNNDKGMALVSVLIIITLLAIMSGTILQMSYLAYSRKITEKRSNETFYTAESVIDTIKATVQNKAAAQLASATDEDTFISATAGALSTASLGMELKDFLYNQIVYVNGKDATGGYKTDVDYFHYQNGDTGTRIIDGISAANGGSFSVGDVVEDTVNKRVVIRDVKVRFVNKMGYVAEIATDIVVNAPVYAMQQMGNFPTGSYSMFAGTGCSVGDGANGNFSNNQMHMGIYLHQEGNVYFGLGNSDGSGRMGSLFLTTQSSSKGGIFFSVGGTNCVFNGDVYLDRGNVLMFTGGNGKEQANVQVNGYIYMTKGATLLLANNVNLVCKGISVRESESGSYVPYTGTGTLTGTLSQFYPMTESCAQSNAATEYNAFLNNTKDVHQVLNKVGMKSGNSNLDTRAYKCASDSPESCGVYILSGNRTSQDGWRHSSSDKYYLVTKSGNTYRTAGKTGLYNNNITTTPDDSNLNAVDNVWYGNVSVDKEFAEIINMPIVDLMNFDTNQYLGTWFFSGYDSLSPSTFSQIKYSNWKYALTSNNLTQIANRIEWDDINDGLQNNDGSIVVAMKDRIFRRPNNTGQDTSMSKTNSIFTITADGQTYKAGQLAVGITQGTNCVVNAGGDVSGSYGYYIALAENDIELHVGNKPYVGMFLSAKKVNMGQSTGVCRGTSLLEMAKHTANPGLDNADNPVRKMLVKLASAAMNNPTNSQIVGYQNMSANATFDGVIMFDNAFNGGIESLWRSQAENNNGGGNLGGDSGDIDFVDVDNWERD